MVFELSSCEWETFRTLANTMIPSLHAEGPVYKKAVERILSTVVVSAQRQLRLALIALSFRGTAFPLTRSGKLVTEMSEDELTAVLQMLAESKIPLLRSFVTGVMSSSMLAFYRLNENFRNTVLLDGEIHPHLKSLRDRPGEEWVIPFFEIPKPLSQLQSAVVSTDVAIVGSGSSAMVAAYFLSRQGYKVMLIEKGYHVNNLTSPEHDYARDIEAFESEGALIANDSSIMILAGSTVGGGGAVNWSCSLRPTEQVRNEWVSRGAAFVGEPVFDEALDAVEDVMKVRTLNDHSFTNSLILENSAKLGYPAKSTGQNTGSHIPNSAFVEFGNRRGVNEGGIAEWLRSAVENGAVILSKAEVTKIRHQHGHASGLEVIISQNGKQIPLLVNCKRVVCAGGSIQTPNLLQRSGFRNKHIGRGLKLHPVTVAFGQFDDVDVNKREDTIMTAVTTIADNLDGQGHGPKIEAIHHRPQLLMAFTPWHNGRDWEAKVRKHRQTSALLVITRDKGHGTVTYDKNRPSIPQVAYSTSNYDLWALRQGCISAANLLYIGGADLIYLGSSQVPDFVPTRPKRERSIWDHEYREWIKHIDETVFQLYNTKVGSAHQMASCRLSNKGSAYGAVDGRGHLYECNNVHVIDSSVFPSASGVNPMISTMAVAYCLTKYLVEDLNRSQTKL